MINFRHSQRARKFRDKWDRDEIAWVMQHLSKGDVVIDVGAHKGGWTHWMRQSVGSEGRVFALEPQPELAAYLRQTYGNRRGRNVEVRELALAASIGELELSVPVAHGSTSPNASLIAKVAEQVGEARVHRVRAVTLDHFTEQNGIPRLPFIKIDVEGGELDALKGAQNVLESLRPAWLIEAESRHTGEAQVREVFEVMERYGYDGFFFADGKRLPIAEFSFSTHQSQAGERFWDLPSYCNNFLFLPR